MLPSSEKRYQPRPWLAIGLVISLSIVAINMAAYLVYRSFITNPTSAVQSRTLTSIQELAIEQREDGIRSLREGNYVEAIRNLESALELDPNLANAQLLVSIAAKLLETELKGSQNPPSPAQQATLLVTTTPNGLIIEVDNESVDLSPAQILLTPGRHRVRLLEGQYIRYDKIHSFGSGQTVTIKHQPPKQQTPRAAKPNKNLSRSSPPPEPHSSSRTHIFSTNNHLNGPQRDRLPSPNKKPILTSRPGLLIYWPGQTSTNLEESLLYDLASLRVRVISSPKAFQQALQDPPDAIMAATSILEANGLSPSLTAEPQDTDRYVAVTLEPIELKQLASASLGVVDELGQRRMPIFVGRLLGSQESPRIRRVQKVEDLLALLQYSIARAVLVRKKQLPLLESLTQQQLHSITLKPASAKLAVAFPRGKPQVHVTEALQTMKSSTKIALGVQSWHP
ncbi:MAG: PEGA domain-containing protein [Myxococcales bacterium]|nr:PEGA domain-containing protein [Myxococcales bacterium]